MNQHWIREKIAHRIGGFQFDQGEDYKFEMIKRLKGQVKAQHPQLTCLDFGIGEPDLCAPSCALETLRISCGQQENRVYADNGAEWFKEAAAHFMEQFFNVPLESSTEVLPILGIKSGLALLAGTLIDPENYVICTTPSYPVFQAQAGYFGGQCITLPLLPENDFLPDLDQIPQDLRPHIKVCTLNYPNNPTGAVASYAFFEKVVQMAQRHHWIIIHDAAYLPLSFDRPISILNVPGAKDCAIELHSMSKGFNMTGWRIGWMCGNALIIKACAKYKCNTDAGQFLAIQRAAVAALQNASQIIPPLVERYQRRVQSLTQILQTSGFHVYKTHGGFFVYVRTPQKVFNAAGQCLAEFQNASLCTGWLLANLNVVTVPWDEVGHYLRFSATFEAHTLNDEQALFAQLQQRLSSYKFC